MKPLVAKICVLEEKKNNTKYLFFFVADENDSIHCHLSDGRIQRHNTTMQEDCNTCTCLGGDRTCTRVDCGASNCWNHTQAGGCPSGGVCTLKRRVGCLTPPCQQWAECSGGGTSSAHGDSGIGEEVCLPNSTDLNGDCAKIHIVFKLEKLPKVRLVDISPSSIIFIPVRLFNYSVSFLGTLPTLLPLIMVRTLDFKMVLNFVNRELLWKSCVISYDTYRC